LRSVQSACFAGGFAGRPSLTANSDGRVGEELGKERIENGELFEAHQMASRRNRTGALRWWSLLPFVQKRSGTYMSRPEIAHFDGPKHVDVRQRSPALGQNSGEGN
jgi:hypothetical protein